jgi:transcriptional regulator with XRE-family HTH domain
MTRLRAMTDYQFRNFLIDEMKRRGLDSARQFAEFLDVDPATVSRAISAHNPSKPGLKFLLQLAEKTGYSVQHLIALAYPDVAGQSDLSPSAALLAQQIEQLPEHLQEVIRSLIRGSS